MNDVFRGRNKQDIAVAFKVEETARTADLLESSITRNKVLMIYLEL